jgi:hypothetical protein
MVASSFRCRAPSSGCSRIVRSIAAITLRSSPSRVKIRYVILIPPVVPDKPVRPRLLGLQIAEQRLADGVGPWSGVVGLRHHRVLRVALGDRGPDPRFAPSRAADGPGTFLRRPNRVGVREW